MLYLTWKFITIMAIPTIAVYANALFEPTLTIVVMLAGLIMLFGAVGIRISNNLGTTVVNGIFRAIGFVIVGIFRALGWIIRQIAALMPRVFRGTNNALRNVGLNPVASGVCSFFVTCFVIALII